jgi:hypothetical protein
MRPIFIVRLNSKFGGFLFAAHAYALQFVIEVGLKERARFDGR